jgi:hypothetical protein
MPAPWPVGTVDFWRRTRWPRLSDFNVATSDR